MKNQDELIKDLQAYTKKPNQSKRAILLSELDKIITLGDYQRFNEIKRRLLSMPKEMEEVGRDLLQYAWTNRPFNAKKGYRFYPFIFPVMVSLPLDYIGYHPSWQPAFDANTLIEHRLADNLGIDNRSIQRFYLYRRLLSPSNFENFYYSHLHSYYRGVESLYNMTKGLDSLPIIPVSDSESEESPAFIDGHEMVVYPRLLLGIILSSCDINAEALLPLRNQIAENRFFSTVNGMLDSVREEYPGSEIRLGAYVSPIEDGLSTAYEWAIGQSLIRRLNEDKVRPPGTIEICNEKHESKVDLMFRISDARGEIRSTVAFSLPSSRMEKMFSQFDISVIAEFLKSEGYNVKLSLTKPDRIIRLQEYRDKR